MARRGPADGHLRSRAVSGHGPAALGRRDAPHDWANRGVVRRASPSPTELLAVEPIQLRAAGLSWRKIDTLRELAEQLSDGRLDEDALGLLPDDEFISALTAISGIGPWTAQGVLLVALRREDVVLPGDLALRKAIRNAYQLDRLPSEQEVLAIAEKWRPFRSLATSYLFASAFDRDDVEA
jgi:DNA-3-methyladenine glycosylase II